MYGRHSADVYVSIPVCGYLQLIAEHLEYDGDLEAGEVGLHLCYSHLNLWLDLADEDPAMEPTLLSFEAAPAGVYSRYWSWWSMDTDTPGIAALSHDWVPSTAGVR